MKDKLTSTNLSKTNTASYLMNITELRDQLTATRNKIDKSKLVLITPNGFGPLWYHFVQCICACEKLPTFETLWDDFIQGEMRLESFSKFHRCSRPGPHREGGKKRKEWKIQEGSKEKGRKI